MKDHDSPLKMPQNGVVIRASHVPASHGEDFGSVTVAMVGGIEFSVYPLSAQDCFTLAGKLESLGRALRQAEADRAKFLAALAADDGGGMHYVSASVANRLKEAA